MSASGRSELSWTGRPGLAQTNSSTLARRWKALHSVFCPPGLKRFTPKWLLTLGSTSSFLHSLCLSATSRVCAPEIVGIMFGARIYMNGAAGANAAPRTLQENVRKP